MIPVRRLSPPLANRFIRRRGVLGGAVTRAVRKILTDFRRDGDGTIRRLARMYDKVDLKQIGVTPREFDAAERAISAPVRDAIRSMKLSVARYHREGLLRGFEIEPLRGVKLGKKVLPYARAGLYVPGGRAVYPSSVVMAAVPAAVAGVPDMVLCTPPGKGGRVPASVLYAAKVCGVKRVFKTGGAQAVFAMAYGTKTIPPCDIIAGPGNAYVTVAKQIVSEQVAIDFLAGPTELLVLSDGSASPAFIAAELIGQAEHDPAAFCLLVTTSPKQAEAVAGELKRQTASSARAPIVREALTRNGALFVTATMDEAVAFSNAFAAEHLTIATRRPLEQLGGIRNAGTVFLGEYSPVAAGDYGAGPNAILPTHGEASFRNGLSANTFLKTVSYQMLSKEGLAKLGPPAVTLAREEQLEAHARSIEVRLES